MSTGSRIGALLFLLLPFFLQAQYLFPELKGEALRAALRQAYKPEQVLSYRYARDTLYTRVFAFRDSLSCFYTGHTIYLDPRLDPTEAAYRDGKADGINCEHAYPRSKGAEHGNADSDMHHLFPTWVGVNQSRGNQPYGEVDDRHTQRWFYRNSVQKHTPPAAVIDLFSESGDGHFEVREDHKGDIARAIFYFYTMYREQADAADPIFFSEQLPDLCLWHHADPADHREYFRTLAIARYQDGKPNPFVLDPTLAERAYCDQD